MTFFAGLDSEQTFDYSCLVINVRFIPASAACHSDWSCAGGGGGGGEWPHPGINCGNGEVKDLAASDRPDREEGASPGCSSLHAAYVCVPVEPACWEGFSAKV